MIRQKPAICATYTHKHTNAQKTPPPPAHTHTLRELPFELTFPFMSSILHPLIRGDRQTLRQDRRLKRPYTTPSRLISSLFLYLFIQFPPSHPLTHSPMQRHTLLLAGISFSPSSASPAGSLSPAQHPARPPLRLPFHRPAAAP